MYAIMHRTQLILEDWQYDTLKSLSDKRGESLSTIVREAIGVYLQAKSAPQGVGLREIEGIGADRGISGRTHDQALYPTRKRPRARR